MWKVDPAGTGKDSWRGKTGSGLPRALTAVREPAAKRVRVPPPTSAAPASTTVQEEGASVAFTNFRMTSPAASSQVAEA